MVDVISLLEQALHATKSAHYERAEDCLRDAYHSLLELRIAQALKTQRLNTAMQHAVTLTRLFPQSPSGYQWQGDIWCDKLDYKRAVEAYKKGVRHSDNSVNLEESAAKATERRDSKLDPVVALPSEVFCYLFEFVPTKRVTAMCVSRQWRQELLSNKAVWKDLSIHLIDKQPNGYWQAGLSRVLSSSLQTLSITTNVKICPLLYLLANAQCTHVKSIVIEDTSTYCPELGRSGQQSFLEPVFIQSLSKLSMCLTSLTITQCSLRPLGLLPVLLTLCPRLVQLTYTPQPFLIDRYSLPTWDGILLPDPQVTDLKRLDWMTYWESDGVNEAAFVVACCPNLQYVRLHAHHEQNASDPHQFVNIIRQECPRLKYLSIGALELPKLSEEQDDKDIPEELQISGIQHLFLDSREPLMTRTDLRSMLVSNQDTITKLVYAGDPDDVSLTPDEVEPLFQLKKLQELTMGFGISANISPLPLLLLSSPALCKLVLVRVTLSSSAFTAIGSLPNLAVLSLTRCPMNLTGVLTFISQSAARQDNPLRKFSYSSQSTTVDMDTFLSDLGLLASLTHLQVHLSKGTTERGLERFRKNARQSGLAKNLRSLDLSVPYADTSDTQRALKKLFGRALNDARQWGFFEEQNEEFGDPYRKILAGI
ncbi:hypothetical protein BCR43DRAFT_496607 [Syncephalastrum racemosum]|uniref:F-box domain-containing protein n=1 Tax=Syncephalastrum racemosum TaxID=13706 RepID=A0A1X2H4D6_SYNRA|nr:hypothetical protein BCR43DRAFT_496607 [Syncephalastrum racemosum]